MTDLIFSTSYQSLFLCVIDRAIPAHSHWGCWTPGICYQARDTRQAMGGELFLLLCLRSTDQWWRNLFGPRDWTVGNAGIPDEAMDKKIGLAGNLGRPKKKCFWKTTGNLEYEQLHGMISNHQQCSFYVMFCSKGKINVTKYSNYCNYHGFLLFSAFVEERG